MVEIQVSKTLGETKTPENHINNFLYLKVRLKAPSKFGIKLIRFFNIMANLEMAVNQVLTFILFYPEKVSKSNPWTLNDTLGASRLIFFGLEYLAFRGQDATYYMRKPKSSLYAFQLFVWLVTVDRVVDANTMSKYQTVDFVYHNKIKTWRSVSPFL